MWGNTFARRIFFGLAAKYTVLKLGTDYGKTWTSTIGGPNNSEIGYDKYKQKKVVVINRISY